ncbi:MAG: hypothetical protein C0518_05540 [Opitutus sp.]|nr:hypothetical protein [Opitutus sp.]
MKKILSFIILAVGLVIGALSAPEATLNVLLVSALCAGAIYAVANHNRSMRRSRLVGAINTLPANWGTHENGKSYFATAAVATRFLLGKIGADKNHIAAVAATSDEPICVMTDEAGAAEDPIGVEFLALTNRTLPVVAGVAITLGADLYALASGKVGIKPTAAGTYWKVGKALEPADADGDVIEMLPQRPRKLIVVSALASANGALAAATADVAAQAVETEKLGDDVRKIAAALDLDADVALATT